ncbi:EF-P 5-aminopentanol modification-associated protein YfmF [Paenibacillus thermotolerans]|uniref:EF-P 5-aminopentanol modification-associated protein YfmF n=1 Tax=Paenibacillus thermotolerans TaxID=3027807 RepID=UPI002368B903|nr:MULTISPECIES: pitrilysin family protein [unclassified Paenibacillus]
MSATLFERDTVKGIRLHVLPTDRYKTTAISVFIGHLLEENTVTPIAVTPFVLRRGTARYPETKQFREALDLMYGAGFGFDIYKRGDYQIVNFRMDVIQDEFVSSGTSLLKEALTFFGETLTKPVLENNRFRERYVEAEKDTVRKKLEAIVNDKARYAAERCIEEMCKDEPYRLHPLGTKEGLESITPESLYSIYRAWLSEAPIDLYVVGNTSLEEVKALVENVFAFERSTVASDKYSFTRREKQVADIHTVVERMEVGQGKLNMGLRVPTSYGDANYATALVYNGILGSFPHSKLFTNVREKASLAYYASSRLDGHKGILTIQSGIEIANYEKAVDIIKAQLAAMRSGEISELEMSQTKAMIGNHLKELNDNAYETIAFDFNSVLSGKERTAEQLWSEVSSVSVNDIVQFAPGVQLDTIYFLRDRKEA